MEQNESFKVFMRFVQERHEEVKANINNMFSALVNEDKQLKIVTCQKTLESSEMLSRSLALADRPTWLDDIIRWCRWYTENANRNDCNNILYNGLQPKISEILAHKWSLGDNPTNADFNFDEIYERFKADSKLPDLFDSLISILDKMIASGEIDSIRAITSIQQLLSLLKQNKSGSYFSVMASWEFLGAFIRNSFWESLDLMPGVKQLKKAFEKTVSDMDIELEEIHNSIAQEMKNKYNTTVNSLIYRKQSNNIIEDKSNGNTL